MLSFIAKRRTKAQKFKSSIRLVSDPTDVTNAHYQTLDIFDIHEKPRQTPPVPSALEEPVADVEEEAEADQSSASAHSEQQEDVPLALVSTISPRVEVCISEEPLNDWFPRHLLKSSGSNELEMSLAIKRRETHRVASDERINSSEHQRQSSPPRDRRLPPTPIKIPNPNLHGPKVQVQRSSIHPPSARPESTISLENLSSVSGTTLARALLGTSFVFPTDSSRRSSRYRSGMTTLTRADSATLPHSDDPLLHSPYWRESRTPDTRDESIPPVPPVPSDAELQRLETKVEERRTASKLLSQVASISPRVSRITESSSPALTENSSSSPALTEESMTSPPTDNDVKTSLVVTPSTASDRLSPAGRSVNSLPRSVPTTASLYPSTPEYSPPPIPSAASSNDGLDNVLDYYQFAASWEYHTTEPHPGRPAFSPITEETSSACLSSADNSPFIAGKRDQQDLSISPASPGLGQGSRIETSPSQSRNRKPLLPIGEQSPSSPTFRTTMVRGATGEAATGLTHYPSLSSQSLNGDNQSSLYTHRRGFSRSRSGSGTIPSPITVVRDTRDPRRYRITVTPSDEELSLETAESPQIVGNSQSQNIQTFPETPRAFSPLWSAGSSGPNSRASLADNSVRLSSLVPRKVASQTSLRSIATVAAASNSLRLSPLAEAPSSQVSPIPDEEVVDVQPSSSGLTPNRETTTSGMNAIDLPALVADTTPTDSEDALISPKSVTTVVNSPPSPPPLLSSPSPSASTLTVPTTSPSHSNASSSRTQDCATSSSTGSTSHHSSSDQRITTIPRINPLPPLPINAQDSSRPYYGSNAEMQDAGLFEPYPGYFGAPPPAYHTIMPIIDVGTSPLQPVTPSSERPPSFRTAEETAGRRLTRSRPPLPAGPRRPSGGVTTLASRSRASSETQLRQRNGSVSSVNSTQRPAYSSCSPKFRAPEPKWKGLTMDAAKWTFTSSELQELVSQSIRQSAETSAVRLVHPQLFNVEIPGELRRLQTERCELTTRYKVLTRKRHALLGALSAQSESREDECSNTWTRTLEELTNLSTTLDNLAEELLSNAEQTTQVTSLRDIHSYSALAMALRKLNTSFIKKVDENQRLQERVMALESAKEEAWKEAETLANDYDALAENLPDETLPESAKSGHRLSRVSRRKSRSGTATQLRSASLRRSQRCSTASSSNFLSSGIPPVPPMPRGRQLEMTANRFTRESTGTQHSDGSMYENTAMLRAQQELYEMLGIPQSARMKRSLTFSGGVNTPTAPSSPTFPTSNEGTQPLTQRLRRPSSLPSTAGLHELYETVSADRQAILSTLGIIAAD